MIPFSILDLSPIFEGSTAAQAFQNTLNLAQNAEKWGYNRYWMAEHHNMPGIASAATSVVIGYVAAGTNTIRVGSGGIMLPNHSPLVIAEQFGTLESLYPGRIDLGVGRAPGADMDTARALRRDMETNNTFPHDLMTLLEYFQEEEEQQTLRAVPGAGLHVPVWILGSSLFGAKLAAKLGLPYSFASHFAPKDLKMALQIYRNQFEPSEFLSKPYFMMGLGASVADTKEEAAFHFTSVQRQFTYIRRGSAGQIPPPVKSMDSYWTPMERFGVDQALQYAIVGDKEYAKMQLQQIMEDIEPDEIIITSQIFDHQARLRSYEILADIRNEWAKP
ncbi:luciferase family oxidoreductase, group 1 [Pseudarcicella hirudinis]|uniref:Luciferase-like monooxygenase n=2 Tax=Pseudarcicella hirudinis TaxID=1079859 RepID=A0A1I5YIS6_9BACT|nr:LLM class flavin-dependent oxidoreductase [Pseudarcicella hirudinis]SFQ44092.1 luciferase family oxidoreductase, group 1 [Pseudarcicella hirudinis]